MELCDRESCLLESAQTLLHSDTVNCILWTKPGNIGWVLKLLYLNSLTRLSSKIFPWCFSCLIKRKRSMISDLIMVQQNVCTFTCFHNCVSLLMIAYEAMSSLLSTVFLKGTWNAVLFLLTLLYLVAVLICNVKLGRLVFNLFRNKLSLVRLQNFKVHALLPGRSHNLKTLVTGLLLHF